MTSKSGWRTTEFWLSLGALLLSAAYASGLIPESGPWEKLAAFGAVALTAAGYSVSRGLAKRAPVLLSCLALTMAVGCASMETTAYRTLATTATTVDGAMNGWGDYVRAGLATDQDQAKVRALYGQYQGAMRAAKAAVNVYLADKSDPNKAAMDTALDAVSAVAAEILTIIQSRK